MRIAATYGSKGRIFQHYGHTETFRIYDINEENQVSSVSMLDANGASCSTLGTLLKENAVDVLICGGIGQNAIIKLEALGIKVAAGVDDDCDIAVAKYLANELDYSLEANCKHEQGQVSRHHCHSHHDDCHDCE